MKKIFLVALLLCFAGCGGSNANITVTFSPTNGATNQVYAVAVTATFSGTIPEPTNWSTVFTVKVAGDTTNLCTSYVWDAVTGIATCVHDNFAKNIQYVATVSGLSGVTDNSAAFTTVSGNTVFVTSDIHNGDFGGLAGADEFCATLATAAGLTGTFRAWLSADPVGATPAVNAKDRIVDSVYVRTDGEIIAGNLTELLAGPLQNAIELDESGNLQSGEVNVWTGSWANGTVCETDNCDGWTTGTVSQDSIVGSSNQTTDGKWNFMDVSVDCNASLHVYCFQIGE